MYEALEKKTGGCIRGTISNSPNLSQALVLKAMGDETLPAEKEQKFEVLAVGPRRSEILAQDRSRRSGTLIRSLGYFLWCA